MAIKRCTLNGMPGFQAVNAEDEECFTYDPTDSGSMVSAKRKAMRCAMEPKGPPSSKTKQGMGRMMSDSEMEDD